MDNLKTLPAIFIILFLSLGLPQTALGNSNQYIVLCYHDIQDNPAEQRVSDAVTLSSYELIRQFDWLKAHNYNIISLDDIRAAKRGQAVLPDKAVLLTFDDGYLSTYTRAFPLLKAYNYPAVVGLVTQWMETPFNRTFQYGSQPMARKQLMSWQQVNEMIDSGLVEIASHSHDLHHGHRASPQGNMLPAATNRIYNENNEMYENDEQYRERIHADLSMSMNLIMKHTGNRPRAIIWPYGSYNQETISIAIQLGMDITMSLDEGTNTTADLTHLKRLYLKHNSSLGNMVSAIHHRQWYTPQRVVHVDLDMVYDQNPLQQQQNLNRLVSRLARLDVNTIYLQAFVDDDGNGVAESLYFPNRHLPVKHDLFGQVANTLRSKLSVRVYAWLPVLAYRPPIDHPLTGRLVQPNIDVGMDNSYYRLSPFDTNVQQYIGDIYEDLAKYVAIDGLLFHDDAVLSDFEDASPAAISVYTKQWGLPGSLTDIRSDPEEFQRWTALKTQWLIDFTHQLSDQVRHYRPAIKTARNLYAQPVLNPRSEEWYAQSLPTFLDNYDYTAIMAMPLLEGAQDPDQWLSSLVDQVAKIPGALKKTVFELQAKDWRSATPVASETLARQTAQLQGLGVMNYGYYPDNLINNQPDIDTLYQTMSLRTFPYDRPEIDH